jgi:glycosidase
MKQSGADGLRVDAVKQMPHILGTQLRARLHDELEKTGVATYMVGETYTFSWDDNPADTGNAQNLVKQYVSDRELNGQFDFPLRWAIADVIANDGNLHELDHVLSQTFTFYGDNAVMSPFFGNHDLPRFISIANGDPTSQQDGYDRPPGPPSGELPYRKLEAAFTLLLTIPGAPMIYYGDEIGMPGAADPDNRRMMRFDGLSPNEQSVLAHARKVGAARQSDVVLRRGDYMTIWVDDLGLLVHARHVAGMPARVIAINKSDAEQKQMVPIPQKLGVPDGTRYTDVLGGPGLVAGGGYFPIDVPPRSSAVYIPR